MFTPQQFYAIGFVQDTWRASRRLTLELGLRYDYFSPVKEKNGLARPFFIEENDFGSDPDNFYDADKNNIAPRLSAAYQLNDKTVIRAGYGHFYGPGQFEDRIQPIENYIERRRVTNTEVPTLAYPVDPSVYRNLLSVRGYTHKRPDEYNVQYRRERLAGAAGRGQPDGGLHGQPGQGHVPARRGQHVRQRDPRPAGAVGRTGGLQDVRMPGRTRSSTATRCAAAVRPATTRCRLA